MGSKKYIPDNSWLTCDKGSAPSRLKVTHHNNTKIYGENLASEMDMVPGENIMPMGRCSVTGGSCQPEPIYWDKCNKGVKVNGYKLVFEDACLLCKQGGKVKVDFDAPSGSSSMAADGLTGLGAGAWAFGSYDAAIDYVQRGVIHDVENGKLSLVRDNSPNDFRRGGNYGEMKDQVFHRQEGWRDVRSEHPNMDIDKPTSPGIDGAYEKNGTYKLTDAKYNGAKLENTATYGRETSRRWTKFHTDNGGINPADREAFSRANDTGTLQREMVKTMPNGDMHSETQNDRGYKQTRGQREAMEVKTSRAGTLINGVRSSIRNSRPVTALANSNFSQAVRSSKLATGANNSLFKATQAVSRSPVLSTAGKVAGRGLIVVGIGLEVLNVYNTYQEEGHFGEKTKEAVGGAAGAIAGAWAGAEIGAIIGTAICPGVGTVIGGLVGGAIGGILGGGLGKTIGSWF
ncbi:protein of unknown function [Chitinophaga jiangningensis]|uniref:DUF4280 domain-containing protein n=1 Tax=Chitinophaga jiangningensis TaxID=1419482 RepID=A0A1M6YHH8_9BACT|nr:PAAR-like protein [Chitinophaga jiangningensis]SHL17469.1 protein of unknown function [Chitinophaga jiangningensis]